MAKVSGPLMSLDARNQFAGAMVFTAWKGRNVVRQLVTPANPRSTDQAVARTAVRVMGFGQHWANLTALILQGQTLTDKVRLRDAAPPGQAWNGFLVYSGIGVTQSNWLAAAAAWTALAAGQKTAWDNGAAALTPIITGTETAPEAGVAATPITAGQVFFHYVWALYAAGLANIPGVAPPVYA